MLFQPAFLPAADRNQDSWLLGFIEELYGRPPAVTPLLTESPQLVLNIEYVFAASRAKFILVLLS